MKKTPISTDAEWTFELIEQYDREISRIAAQFNLDTYPNQIEVINAEQMMDAYASVGMPLHYRYQSKLPARSHGTRLRNRDQFRSLHRLFDGRKHHDDASTGHCSRLLWSQFFF